MAGRVRNHDWAATPLGPVEDWPQSLKTVVDLILVNPIANILVCGPERVLIYNDACIRLYGEKHPRALGLKGPDAFPELWGEIGPIYDRVFSGERLSFEAQPWAFDRDAAGGAGLYDAWFTPGRGEDGEVAFAFVTAVEVTQRASAGAALRDSEARFRSIVDQTVTGVVRTDAEGRMVLVNRHWCEMLGYSEDELVGKSIFEITHPDSLAATSEAIDHLAGGGNEFELEKRYVRKDGSALWAISNLNAVRNAAGAFLGLTAVVLDITGRKGDEEALRESEERLAAELADARRLQETSTRLIGESSPDTLYEDLLGAAMAVMHAGFGSMQLYHPDRNMLELIAWKGFHPESAAFWEWVRLDSASTCGKALETGARVIIPDVKKSDFMAGTDDLHHFLHSGIHAVQSTPLISRGGRMLGMISTHWREPHDPSERDLNLLDVLARQAADLLERAQAEAALRESGERQAFLLKLSDALRPLENPGDVQLAAARTLGEHLGVDRCFYFVPEWENGEQINVIERDFYIAAGMPSLVGRYPVRAFGAAIFAPILRGEVVAIADVEALPNLSPQELQSHRAVNARTFVSVPLFKKSEYVAGFGIIHSEPRQWTSGEIALILDVAERTWAAVERARAEAALRESEEKYRSLFETMDQGYGECEMIRDREGRAIDYRIVEVNPAFERLFGPAATNARGRTAREILPDLEDWWVETFEDMLRVDTPVRVEREVAGSGWFHVSAYPMGGERFAYLFDNITVRKRAEKVLRESEERQSFLLELSDAFRANTDPEGIGALATRMVAEHMHVDRCYIAQFTRDKDRGWIGPEYRSSELPPLAGEYRFADFPEGMKRIETGPLIIRDVLNDESLSETDKQSMGTALGVRGMLAAVLRRGQRNYFWCLTAATIEPRDWTDGDLKLLEDVAERTWAAIDRTRVEATLRESEERFRHIVESASDYAIFTTDAEGVVNGWFEGAEMVFGYAEDEIVGRDAAILFTPEDRAAGVVEEELRIARKEGSAPDIRWHLCKGGSRVFIEGRSVALTNGGGQLRGYLKIGQDVTERRRAEAALAESEERFRQFGEASSDVLWIRDADTLQWEYLSPAFEAIYGQIRAEALAGDTMKSWAELIVPEDREHAVSNIRRVGEGERVAFEYRIRRPSDGEVRWLRDTDFPIMGEKDQVRRIGGIGQDITEAKKAEDRMHVLVAELQHRTRNLIAVVRSLADKTRQESSSFDDFQVRYGDRLQAVARVQGLLSRLGEDQRVAFDELLRAELMAHGVRDGNDGHVTLEGPAGVPLRSGTVQTFALALHELATNAAKYGALSQPDGHLTVRWRVETDGAGRQLHVEWRESGVAMPANAAPQGGGYGRELIERALPYQLKARTSYEMGTDGVRCTIAVPISGAVQAQEDPHG